MSRYQLHPDPHLTSQDLQGECHGKKQKNCGESYGTPMNPIGMDMIMEISLLETVGTTIWLFVTVRHGKIHHAIIKFGKPSIMGHLYHGKLLYSHNQRVSLLSLLNTAKSPCY